MRPILLCIISLAFSVLGVRSQDVEKINSNILDRYARTEINLPMVDGYMPLKADLHLHSIFSDGYVWPTVRVDEAWRDGLDVIALTDHIEYLPFQSRLNSDHNTSYEVALPAAEARDILLIRSCELTRAKKEGGHLNILFISDAQPFDTPKLEDAINEAVRQNAYVIWNHPGWPDNICDYNPVNARWVDLGKIHAVEVFNEKEYYPYATSWCESYNLAPIAASDAHTPIRDLYKVGVVRPYTIIFARERTLGSVREALDSRRTLAVFDNQVAGSEELLARFFKASAVKEALGNGSYRLTNNSDIMWVTNLGTVAPRQTIVVSAKDSVKALNIRNFYPNHQKSLTVQF